MCLLSACSPRSEQKNSPSDTKKQTIQETLARAEELFRQREDIVKLKEAQQLTTGLRDVNNRNFEVEWKFSQYSCILGQRIEEATERVSLFEKGRDAGLIASRLDPNRPEGFFWFGANLGELSEMSPFTVGIRSVGEIRDAMNKVIELQPDYEGASAYDINAQIELSRLMGGKPSKAVELLEKALEIEKNNSNIYLHLGQAYLTVGKNDLARQQLEYLVNMQPDPNYIPEHKLALEQAKKLLASRF